MGGGGWGRSRNGRRSRMGSGGNAVPEGRGRRSGRGSGRHRTCSRRCRSETPPIRGGAGTIHSAGRSPSGRSSRGTGTSRSRSQSNCRSRTVQIHRLLMADIGSAGGTAAPGAGTLRTAGRADPDTAAAGEAALTGTRGAGGRRRGNSGG